MKWKNRIVRAKQAKLKLQKALLKKVEVKLKVEKMNKSIN
jgi:hypothetical protein